jgi:hypothetical protein
MGQTRRKKAPTEWNLFVKKIFHEGRRNNANYKFKNALEDASRRKNEMSSSSASLGSNNGTFAPKRRRPASHKRRRSRRRRY